MVRTLMFLTNNNNSFGMLSQVEEVVVPYKVTGSVLTLSSPQWESLHRRHRDSNTIYCIDR